VLGYNALVRGNKGVITQLNRFAYDLHALFVTGARIGSPNAFKTAKVLPLHKA
jgi:biopolymer transport protein ExbB